MEGLLLWYQTFQFLSVIHVWRLQLRTHLSIEQWRSHLSSFRPRNDNPLSYPTPRVLLSMVYSTWQVYIPYPVWWQLYHIHICCMLYTVYSVYCMIYHITWLNIPYHITEYTVSRDSICHITWLNIVQYTTSHDWKLLTRQLHSLPRNTTQCCQDSKSCSCSKRAGACLNVVSLSKLHGKFIHLTAAVISFNAEYVSSLYSCAGEDWTNIEADSASLLQEFCLGIRPITASICHSRLLLWRTTQFAILCTCVTLSNLLWIHAMQCGSHGDHMITIAIMWHCMQMHLSKKDIHGTL